MKPIGIGKKLYVSSIGIILLTILIIASVSFYQTKASFLEKGKIGIQNVSDVLLKTIKVQHNLLEAKLESDINILKSDGNKDVMVTLVETMTADINAYDVNSDSKEALAIPKLAFGPNIVTADYKTVDMVARFSDSEIMVYQLFEDRLIKVSTSFTNKDGNRSIGEFYTPSSNPYKSVIAETPYQFLSSSGKEISLQKMQSFRDALEDEIAGAFSIRRTILTKDLVDLVHNVTVSGQGYCFVSDAQGNILTKPKKGLTAQTLTSFEGGEDILKTKNGSVSYTENQQLYYAYVNYFEPWDLYFTVAVSKTELMTGINKQIFNSVGISGVIALIIGILIIGVINRQLLKNMVGMATMAKQVSQGNFNHSFKYKAKDAIQDTVNAMNEMVDELAHMIGKINSSVGTLSTSSGELNNISDQMNTGAETTVSQINTVASAAEEMSVNMNSVAAAMEQASTNIETVATGTKHVQTSIETVVKNSNHTREITNQAVDQAKQASERVRILGKAADAIDKVTETITDISSQTNLLALNATIEAARAGEAGKGFAVVATEIKALANQTSTATQDIAENIKEIQSQISATVTEIKDISTIIHEINTFVNETATAIDGQSEATSEITENIQQLSLGIQEVNENVSQSSDVSGQVAQEIVGVLDASEQTREYSSELKKRSITLNEVMVQLKSSTAKFQI